MTTPHPPTNSSNGSSQIQAPNRPARPRPNPVRLFLWALVALGCLAALASARARWGTESRNRRVEITLDYNQLREMAAAEGVPLSDVLRQFRQAGATSVAVQEETIGGLEEARRIQVSLPTNLDNSGKANTRFTPTSIVPTWTIPSDRADPPAHVAAPADAIEEAKRITAALEAKTKFEVRKPGSFSRFGNFNVYQPYAVVRSVGIGLAPDTVKQVQAAGLNVVGRVSNWEGVRPAGLRWTLDQLKSQNVRTILFSGDEVLGFKGYVAHDKTAPEAVANSTEDALRANGQFFGAVEFSKQRGNDQLARIASDRVVRAHTILGSEMVSADIPGNVQRFLLAARERNIRLLFVRLFPSEPNAIHANLGYVEKIAAGLERGRLELGPAHGYRDLATGKVLRLLMGLGLAAGWLLLVDAVTGLLSGAAGANTTAVRWLRLVAGAGALGLLALPVVGDATGPKLAALASACIFPSLALLWTDLLAPDARAAAGPGARTSAVLELAFRRLLVSSAITLIGALFIVGLLADRRFLIKADAFAGIKFSQLIPLALVAVVYFFRLQASRERPWANALADARAQIVRLGTQPMLLWQVGAGAAVLVLLALVVARSGNDPGVGVSAVELKLRAVLDRLLYTRPRFKEFLIGHPAMVIALALAVTRRRNLALPLLLVGALGQVSLLNTFCHLHTPLFVSLLRALLGFVIGTLLGTAAYLILVRLFVGLRNGPHPLPLPRGGKGGPATEVSGAWREADDEPCPRHPSPQVGKGPTQAGKGQEVGAAPRA